MATMVLCLALLCLYNLTPPSESVTPARRSEEIEKYVIHDETGGTKSHLFSQCMADARTVEGVLYSIAVTDDEEFVRFVPKEKMEVQWTIVDLEDGKGIIDCAHKVYELGAYMFKFDGSCSVAPTSSSYDPKSEQVCDEDATEVVYITSRSFNVVDGEVVPYGESRGCLYSSPEGMKYGEDGHLVSEVQLPPPDVCSPTAEKGYHLVADCSLDGMNFCEAQTRCEARGLPMASKRFYDEFAPSEDWTSLPSDVGSQVSSNEYFKTWVNIQMINGTFYWMDDMVVILESDFSGSVFSGEDRGYVIVYNFKNHSEVYAEIHSSQFPCVYCHDPNSILSQC